MANLQCGSERAVAYSYVRFSTAKQELGDSLRRQVSMAEDYCAKYGLELHPLSFRDLGVSAFKRKNLERGALAAFIDAVKTGKIQKGSYLVIEQFDRLTRAEIDFALKLLLDLVHSGITVVTLVDERIWNSETVKDLQNLMLAIVFMSRANNESATKADRLSRVWGEKKKAAAESGKIMSRECPRWLAVNEDKSAFLVLEDRVESVRKVFAMRIAGHGVVSIVNRANKEKWPVPGKGETWHISLVGRLLRNRALLGEYQPHSSGLDEDGRVAIGDPVAGYYPAILDEQTFLRAQATRERKAQFPGRRDVNYRNWLQGLLKCTCGQSFVRKNKTSAKQPGYARYYCAARSRGASDCASVGAKEVETAVIYAVSQIAPQFWNGSDRLAELVSLVDVQQVNLTAAQQRRDRFLEAIGMSEEAIPSLLQRLTAAEAEVVAAESVLAATRAEISEMNVNGHDVFENIVKAVANVESLDARAQLREDLSRVLLKCVIDAEAGVVHVHVRGESRPIVIPLRLDANLPGAVMGQMSEEQYVAEYGRSLEQVEQ
ncbi:recombinase family protein [Paraburkholderia tropica]|uniref:recombinase family protein n=1 Tax=Paraburkholderia tropica TaxID=92647 RepID=UPI001590E982|nr:recombinase family protein [Paraburkholderia tropica]